MSVGLEFSEAEREQAWADRDERETYQVEYYSVGADYQVDVEVPVGALRLAGRFWNVITAHEWAARAGAVRLKERFPQLQYPLNVRTIQDHVGFMDWQVEQVSLLMVTPV